ADAGRDLVVARRRRRLARDLPERAPQEGVAEPFPEIEPRGAREAVVHRSLVGMPELVHGERIAIDHPARAQVAADGVDVGIEIAAAEIAAVELVQEEIEADDL